MIFVDELRKNNFIIWSNIVKTCHLFSDKSIVELINFANSIGLKGNWIQTPGKLPHFDLTENKSKLALDNGAIELTNDGLKNKLEGFQKIRLFEYSIKKVIRDNKKLRLLLCPKCGIWIDINTAQFNGNSNIKCVCGFYKTIKLRNICIMIDIKEKMIKEAYKKYDKIYIVGSKKNLNDCFIEMGGIIYFWFNDEYNSTHVIKATKIPKPLKNSVFI